MNLTVDLGSRLSITDIRSLASLAMADTAVCDALFATLQSDDYRAAGRAAWALTHLPKEGDSLIAARRDELVRLAITTADVPLRRLSLNLLERLDWPEEEVRTDLLDFCLARLLMPAETPGVRALCAKLAWLQCHHYPELADELRRTLLFIEPETLKPGLRHTHHKILDMLKKTLALILLFLASLGTLRATTLPDSLAFPQCAVVNPNFQSSILFASFNDFSGAHDLRFNSQFSDSLRCHYDHAFTPSQLIAPGTLITAGSIITATPSLHLNIDRTIRDNVQDYRQGHDYLAFHYEDYVQYVPMGSVFLLKACGLKSQHEWRDLLCLTAGSCVVGFGINRTLKYTCAVERPDGRNFRSFPSGHTTTAFLGAEILRREYGEEYPAIAVAGYTIATGVACSRVWHNRHWFSDLLGGAGFSILSVGLTYWLAPYLRF